MKEQYKIHLHIYFFQLLYYSKPIKKTDVLTNTFIRMECNIKLNNFTITIELCTNFIICTKFFFIMLLNLMYGKLLKQF